jgi:hypothetical protein
LSLERTGLNPETLRAFCRVEEIVNTERVTSGDTQQLVIDTANNSFLAASQANCATSSAARVKPPYIFQLAGQGFTFLKEATYRFKDRLVGFSNGEKIQAPGAVPLFSSAEPPVYFVPVNTTNMTYAKPVALIADKANVTETPATAVLGTVLLVGSLLKRFGCLGKRAGIVARMQAQDQQIKTQVPSAVIREPNLKRGK